MYNQTFTTDIIPLQIKISLLYVPGLYANQIYLITQRIVHETQWNFVRIMETLLRAQLKKIKVICSLVSKQ